MHRCEVCDEPISEERIKAYLKLIGELPTTCQEHSSKLKPIGFMSESGGKEGRKTGYVLTILDPNQSNYRENKRRAMNIHNRKR